VNAAGCSCDAFEKHQREARADHGNGEFIKDEGKPYYSINGCCGGGCYVVTGVLYCPFCGTRLIP
jgi:hypothetical protein